MKRSSVILALVVTAICALTFESASSGVRAQSGSDGWTRLGSLTGGVWEIASDSASPTTLYALANEGISKSSDGGASWSICNGGARSMRVLTPLPGQTGNTVLYATTSDGLRTSEDGCRTWRDVPTQDVAPSGAHIRFLTTYPNNHAVLYAGMDGLGGLYRSTDTGSSWHPAAQGLPAGAWVTSLTADALQPQNVFVGVRYTGRNKPAAYVYRSTDGGLTWRSSSIGIYMTPNDGGYVTGLAWSGDLLFAATLHNGIFASSDRGSTWKASTTPRRTGATGATAMPMTIDSLLSTWSGALVISTAEGAYQSLDGGHSWQAFGPKETLNKHMIVSLDMNTGRALLGSRDGIWAYNINSNAVAVPTNTAVQPPTATVTPPPPPQLPTFTAVPPTPTATNTVAPPTPTRTPVSGYKPSDPAQPIDSEAFTFFPQTNHNLGHAFRDYWQANGGVGQFGFPLTEEFNENGIAMQYFERARFEYRDGQVILARLGAELIAGTFYRPIPFFPSVDDDVYFGATGHSISGPFLNFWRANGREPLLGLPLSQSFKEDGSEYQWFERSRLEWHPYLPESSKIVLGNIGADALKARGWLK
ncbi:MAG: hypothetical protein ABI670_18140 [Chloroflexota bacterium]